MGRMWHRTIVLSLLAGVPWSCAAPAVSPAQVPASTTVTLFEGARLITGDGAPAIEDAAFVVDGGRITQVGRRGAVTAAGASRVDLTGKTVIPALVDAHSHIGYVKGMTSSPANYTRENILDHMRRFAYYGVAASQAMGSDFGELPVHTAGRTGGRRGPECRPLSHGRPRARADRRDQSDQHAPRGIRGHHRAGRARCGR